MYEKEHEQGFDNDAPAAPEQLGLLSQILNRETFGILGTEVAVGHAWRCWDIGTGEGSVARWLAARVGTGGHVVASDLKPQHVPVHPRIEPLEHDLTRDPWPEPEFDLIHARLVLMHIADREGIAAKLGAHLRPGGALVITDWFCGWCADGVMIRSESDDHTKRIFQDFHDAVHKLAGQTGMDFDWALRMPDVLAAAGFTDVTVRDYQAPGQGGTPTSLLARLHSTMMEPYLLSQTDLTPADLAVIREKLLDPEFEMVTNYARTAIVRAPK